MSTPSSSALRSAASVAFTFFGGLWLSRRDGPLYLDTTLDGLTVKSVLGLDHDCGEDLRLRYRKVGQDLAVQVDLGQLQPVDEPRVREAVLPDPGVDALDPERPEIPFALLASLVGVDPALPDLLFGPLVGGMLGTAIPLRLIQDLPALLAGVDAACRTRHASAPPAYA